MITSGTELSVMSFSPTRGPLFGPKSLALPFVVRDVVVNACVVVSILLFKLVLALFAIGILVVVVVVVVVLTGKFVKLFLIVVAEVIFTSVKGFVVVLDLSICTKTKRKIKHFG